MRKEFAMLHISTIFLLFMIYSILGWLFETIYCSLTHLSWDNRGMLNGPYCPIYGVGAILAAILCQNMTSPWHIFLTCAVGASILEYFTSFVTEKLFHAVWWDYSYLPFNLNGRICLSVALGFGFAGIVVVRFLHPVVFRFVNSLPFSVHEFLALFLMCIFSADIALTLDALTSLNQKLAALEDSINESISERYNAVISRTKETLNSGFESVKEKFSYEEFKEKFTSEELNRFIPSLNIPQKHIMKSFQGFRKVRYSELGSKLKATIKRKKNPEDE